MSAAVYFVIGLICIIFIMITITGLQQIDDD